MLKINKIISIKDSNYCFNSVAIRLRSKDLKHLIPSNGVPELQGYHVSAIEIVRYSDVQRRFS